MFQVDDVAFIESERIVKLIVGLGNPGLRYEKTKHNVGFRVIDAIYDKIGSGKNSQGSSAGQVRSIYNSLVIQTVWHTTDIILAKPMTYMNNSGAAVAPLVRRYEIGLSDIVVIYDDVHIDIGKIRIRQKGSDGGQKGMQSIIRQLGTTEFPRVRIGVGEPVGDLVDYVLSEFSEEEENQIEETIERTVAAVETILKEGILTAMNQFNGK